MTLRKSSCALVTRQKIEQLYGRSLAKSDIIFLCALVGHLMNIPTKEEFNSYLESIFIILCSRRKDKAFQDALNVILQSAKDLEDYEREFIMIDSNDSNDEKDDFGFADDEKEAIYKSSSFYRQYIDMLESVRSDQDDSSMIDNQFYNPAYAADFVKRNVAYLPFWSAIFTAVGKEEYVRPNNGAVEGYFQKVKAFVDANPNLSRRGMVKIGRYIEELKKSIAANLNQIRFKVPDRHLSRAAYGSKATRRSQSLPEADRERWRGKSSQSSGIFGSTRLMIAGSGK